MALALLVLAAALTGADAAASYAGSTLVATFPPPGATYPANSSYFPDATQVGYPGPTPTGAEPDAIATAISFAESTDAYPLVIPDTADGVPYNLFQAWGNLSPFESLPADAFGLPDASPQIPPGCGLTQVHLLHRHGARYPTSGGWPADFGGLVQAAAAADGFTATGPLDFLNTWTYNLGAEILTPYGRKQLFDLGATFRIRYGELLNGFNQLPVFRTTSENRMVESALNFAAGFFDISSYQTSYYESIIIENSGYNNTLAPWDACPNANTDAIGYYGGTVQNQWLATYLPPAVARLQPFLDGIELNVTSVYAMQELCAYETVALGYSAFCDLFTAEEWHGFEYSIDLDFWYSDGPGQPTAAAQGLGWAQELYARLTQTPVPAAPNSAINTTLDASPTTFPLYQPIFVDASHDTVIANIVTALNFTTLAAQGPLPATYIPAHQTYLVNQIAPFGSNLVGQVLSCPASSTPTHIRFILNDAVIPLTGLQGCAFDALGRCELGAFLGGLAARIAEIDFAHDCYANYSIPQPDDIIDGRYP